MRPYLIQTWTRWSERPGCMCVSWKVATWHARDVQSSGSLTAGSNGSEQKISHSSFRMPSGSLMFRFGCCGNPLMDLLLISGTDTDFDDTDALLFVLKRNYQEFMFCSQVVLRKVGL